MAGTLKNLDCHPIKIGGVEEHVHVFCSLSKNSAFSDLIGRWQSAKLISDGDEVLARQNPDYYNMMRPRQTRCCLELEVIHELSSD
jgi:hypothetical protein